MVKKPETAEEKVELIAKLVNSKNNENYYPSELIFDINSVLKGYLPTEAIRKKVI